MTGKREHGNRKTDIKKVCKDKVDTRFTPGDAKKRTRKQCCMRGCDTGSSELKLKCVPQIPPEPKLDSSEQVQRTYH